MKLVLPKPQGPLRLLFTPAGKVFLALCLLTGVTGLAVLAHHWSRYARLIEQKLSRGPFDTPSKIFAAPEAVYVGERAAPAAIVSRLRAAGYSEASTSRTGWYRLRPDAIEIFPGSESYFASEPAVVKFQGERVARIVSLRDNTEQQAYELEPELITNLFDKSRDKRRLVRFEEIPKVQVNAIVSIEDKRFFDHAGFDPLRLVKAAYVDLRDLEKAQGASTLSQQLARSFFLYPDKRWRRKVAELLIALQLEGRLTKEQIFEFYCNQVYLGRRGSFNIHGIGEASQAFFGKDFRDLSLPEAAALAGQIQRPSYRDPFRHPDRARERRNVVLGAMLQNGYITQKEHDAAVKAPFQVAVGHPESSDAPYFVDMINEQLLARFPEKELVTQVFRVYTTLDLNLQRAAVEAVRYGMPLVDEQVRKQRRFRGLTPPTAQVALVALDPHSGEVKALVGGRNYGLSQLNRALAKRQPGSAFKPFVYAAALNSALDPDAGPVITPVSTVEDAPTTFWFDGKPYEPANFKNEVHGTVTLRLALAKSINIATVKFAETVGYDQVVRLARRAGMNLQIQPTPAVALGAYEVQPIEIAGAYTIFANAGVHLAPFLIRTVRSQDGRTVLKNQLKPSEVLDPRIAYMMTNLLEEVMRSGTAAGVRGRGFVAPAAGKTGTSDHDGWFAGYTSDLLCVVWVGFDDNTELDLEGAKSALPIWTDFMKRAVGFRAYRNPAPFQEVDGIVTVEVDPETGDLAAGCPAARAEVFIAGTQPASYCRLHGRRPPSAPILTTVSGWETDKDKKDKEKEKKETREVTVVAGDGPASADAPRRSGITIHGAGQPPAGKQPPEEPPKKKGVLGRILGVFR